MYQKLLYKIERNRKGQKMCSQTCPICSNKFQANRWVGQKYCSPECKEEANRIRCKRIYKPHTYMGEELSCIGCMDKFIQHTSNQIFCSYKCREKYYKKQYQEASKGLIKINNSNSYSNFLKLRFELFKRDGFCCQYCGRNVREDKIKLQIEHIIPRSKGGKFESNNLITSCEECNLGKRDVLLSERKLIKKENVKKQ